VKGVLDLLKAGVKSNLVGSLMSVIVSQLPGILKSNKDDLWLAHSHSGFDFDNYGVEDPSGIQNFKLRNDRAYCTLRIRVVPD